MKSSKFWFLRCIFRHPVASELEEWISTKDYSNNELPIGPKWHIPSDEEVNFANELLNLHFKAALDDLLTMCQTKIHSDSGNYHSYSLRNFSHNLTDVVKNKKYYLERKDVFFSIYHFINATLF